MLYYGDEVGMTGGNDPDCRKCMIWDKSNWNLNILETVKLLIQIRKNHPAIRKGNVKTLLTFNGVLAFRRMWEEDQVIIILNPRNRQTDLSIPLKSSRFSHWKDNLSGKVYSSLENKILVDDLPAHRCLILIPFDH